MRGVCLSVCSTERKPFAGWLKPDPADHLVRRGFAHVRFLLTWEAIEPQDGVFDDAYLATVRQELDWLAARGIRAIVDMHEDQFSRRFGGDGFPEWVLAPD